MRAYKVKERAVQQGVGLLTQNNPSHDGNAVACHVSSVNILDMVAMC